MLETALLLVFLAGEPVFESMMPSQKVCLDTRKELMEQDSKDLRVLCIPNIEDGRGLFNDLTERCLPVWEDQERELEDWLRKRKKMIN